MDDTSEIRPFLYSAGFEPMPFEVDFTGHLSNTVVVRWMEILRVKMMHTHFGEVDTGLPENLSVIAKTQISYLKVIKYGTSIVGSVWVSHITRASWSVGFQFADAYNQDTAMTAEQIGVFLNQNSLRPSRIPEIIRNKYLRYTYDLSLQQ